MPKSTPNKSTTDEDLELLAELGIDIAPEPTRQHSPREERIIAGFEEIERFVAEKGRLPQHGEDRDIFDRLYAVRLERLRASAECRALLEPLDSQGLLNAENDASWALEEDLEEDQIDAALLASLGVDAASENDVTQLTHVRSRREIKAAEEVAQRFPCEDFEEFKLKFEEVARQLKTGERQTVKYQDNATINPGDLFILDGQKVLVVEMEEMFVSEYGLKNCRMRVIYDNGTQSNPLFRSFQRALNKDKTSRRITKVDLGPLFSLQAEPEVEAEEDLPTGYIYVLRSESDHPFIAQNRSIIHKIGVTGGEVKKRIANAKQDPTYLLADVEIVATFKLANINRKKLEGILQRFFVSARLDLELRDRFDMPVKPREWFLVPLEAIEEAIGKIQDGTIEQFRYEPETASLIRAS
ncbi:GIY-YIG nuclease family protein [Oscillatoria acuminata]|uniref:T5orf172 domain-containing protein n=1 Tax=Oscillatoria acuminata PCC 6304 TaxID=56110 RepID=K9TKZ7_9CYAN|nr:GIY-YIG nuclease family protein [Oscillatoria acuminata]AFY83215.1 T5orf172 domain-containing protein [Oscillatoria acuminata PCC 6304]